MSSMRNEMVNPGGVTFLFVYLLLCSEIIHNGRNLHVSNRSVDMFQYVQYTLGVYCLFICPW